jgi:predicted aldo/keto reductase-like oxidoreductase
MPCPSGVNIPGCFLVYNNKYMEGGWSSVYRGPGMEYLLMVGGVEGKPGYASQCKACGKCVKVCPQHLDIPLHLQEVKKEIEGPGLTATKLIFGAFRMYNRRMNLKKAKI